MNLSLSHLDYTHTPNPIERAGTILILFYWHHPPPPPQENRQPKTETLPLEKYSISQRVLSHKLRNSHLVNSPKKQKNKILLLFFVFKMNSVSSSSQLKIHLPHFSEPHSRNVSDTRKLQLPFSSSSFSTLYFSRSLGFPFRSDFNFPRGFFILLSISL